MTMLLVPLAVAFALELRLSQRVRAHWSGTEKAGDRSTDAVGRRGSAGGPSSTSGASDGCSASGHTRQGSQPQALPRPTPLPRPSAWSEDNACRDLRAGAPKKFSILTNALGEVDDFSEDVAIQELSERSAATGRKAAPSDWLQHTRKATLPVSSASGVKLHERMTELFQERRPSLGVTQRIRTKDAHVDQADQEGPRPHVDSSTTAKLSSTRRKIQLARRRPRPFTLHRQSSSRRVYWENYLSGSLHSGPTKRVHSSAWLYTQLTWGHYPPHALTSV